MVSIDIDHSSIMNTHVNKRSIIPQVVSTHSKACMGSSFQVIQDSERHDREKERGYATTIIASVIEGSPWCIFVTAQAWTCGPTKTQHQITSLQHVPSHV